MLAALLMIQAAASAPPVAFPDPGPEAVALGTRLAASGTLGQLLPLMGANEADEMVAAHPELSADDQAALRRTAAATMEAAKAQLFAAEGRTFAQRLSPDDLRALVARAEDPLADRYRAAVPAAIMGAMTALGSFDFKRATLAAFCRQTGKACAK